MTTSAVELWRMEIETRWSDMDAQDHINNLAYLEYMQECRVNWFTSLKLDESFESVVVSINIEYLQELLYPAPVTVIMTGSDPGRSSFMSHYEIWTNNIRKILFARGDAKIVFIDSQKRRSVSMPLSVKDKLEQPH